MGLEAGCVGVLPRSHYHGYTGAAMVPTVHSKGRLSETASLKVKPTPLT